MSSFEDLFYNSEHRICQKWDNYFKVYDRFFSRFRGREHFTFLEIGVSQGGSLDLWRHFFGPHAKIVGVDIDPRCKAYEGGNTGIRIGSQSDPEFLADVVLEFGPFDAVLDDGGHTMEQQLVTFASLYPAVVQDGCYMVEDVHSSYDPAFGGGLGNPGTFIEFAKAKIDELNGFHIHSKAKPYTHFTRTTDSISFYDSIVVFEKALQRPPRIVQTGTGA